jgi:hypothetical protein
MIIVIVCPYLSTNVIICHQLFSGMIHGDKKQGVAAFTLPIQDPHGAQECPMSPANRAPQRHTKARTRRLKARERLARDRRQAQQAEVHTGNLTVIPSDDMAPYGSLPDDLRFDLLEMVSWWRQRRKIAQEYAGTLRETVRMTYHVEPRYIELIKEFAKSEGVSITDVVNRAFRQFFEGR